MAPVLLLVIVAGIGFAVSGKANKLTLQVESSRIIADKRQKFTELSGLSLAAGGGFWAVGDDTARIFRLDQAGDLVAGGDLKAVDGLEGVAWDDARGRLLAVEEDTATILEMTDDGATRRVQVPDLEGAAALIPANTDWTGNNGLEGITVEPDSGTVFVIKERRPRLLLEISPELDRIRRCIILSRDMGFVSEEAADNTLDVSGLQWDPMRRGLWITSDTGKTIYFLDVETMSAKAWALLDAHDGKLKPVSNAEGVTLSENGTRLHVVTDAGAKSRLLAYRVTVE